MRNLVAALSALAVVGCAVTSNQEWPPGRGDQTVRDASCPTAFRFTAPIDAAAVEVAGEWNWEAPTPLADEDRDGTYEGTVNLAPGLRAYKLVVTRSDGTVDWLIDPGARYRKYEGGTENSAVRVPDCRVPGIELLETKVSGNSFRARLRLTPGTAETAVGIGDLSVTRRHQFVDSALGAEVTRVGEEVAIEIPNLPAGKHTVTVRVSDEAGKAAPPLRLPFWIEEDRFEWRGALIYMAMLDRFANGTPENDAPPSGAADRSADFLGGDIRGLTQAIESGYLDELGITALWLSPLNANADRVHIEHGHGVTAYHGYWPAKARAVDPRFGTEEDLEALVRAAHARGIRVLLDYVINHVHEDHEYVASNPEWFRTGCKCGTPGCGWTEKRLECLFHESLPDVNWSIPEAADQFVDDAVWWLDRFDLDGLRVDAVKHVEDAAILNLSARVADEFEQAGTSYFLLGETAMGWAGHSVEDNRNEYDTISRYIGKGKLTGQFDFVLYHAASYRVWADDEYGLAHLDFWTKTSLEQYPSYAVMTPFIGSHDNTRFVTLADLGSGNPMAHHKWSDQGLPPAPTDREPYERARVALPWLLSLPGAPLLYYGDEYGEYGAADPDNRHMWRPRGQRTAAEQELFDTVSRAGRARKRSRALRRGAYTTLLAEDSFLAFARHTATDIAVVLLNHSGQAASRTISLPPGLPAPRLLKNELSPGSAVTPVLNRTITVTLPARSAAILLPASEGR